MYKLLLIMLLFGLMMGVSAQVDHDLEDDGQFIEIDGFQIYYIERGSVDNPTVMLLHGFGGSTFTWRDNMDVLVEAGYRVIAYDRPPFGLSDKRPDFSLDGAAQAAQAIAFADALGVESAVWVGHSMGGGVIAHIAVGYPERVDALVFVAGAVQTTASQPAQEAEAQADDAPLGGLSELAANLDPQSPLAQNLVRTFLTEDRFIGMLSSAYHPSYALTDEVAAGYMRMLSVEGWEAAFIALYAAGRSTEPLKADDLAAVDVPVLIVWGQDDTWVPLAAGEQLHDLLPAAEMITYAETGHLPMEEQVEQFNADLLRFLSH